MPNRKITKKLLLPILVLLITIGLLYIMALFKPKDEKKGDVKIVPTVETIQIDAIDYIMPIKSHGTVLAKAQINISAEIVGKVIYISDKFSNGGTFAKGDVLLKIDPIDYQLAITRAQASVAAQQADLDLQQAKSDLAKKDWQKYGKKGKPNALNLNLPQVASAKAALSAAKADLKLAVRNLDKSIVIVPFAGVILTKHVDLGQFLSIGTPLASIAATAVAEIRISLSDVQLHNSGLDEFTPTSNIPVIITSQETNDTQWQGQISAIEAQRDMKTLFNYAIVEVGKPFTQQNTPLRFNTFVEVQLQGNTLKNVYPIERGYVSIDNKVKVFVRKSRFQTVNQHLTASDAQEYMLAKINNFNLYYSIINIKFLEFYKYLYPYIFQPRSQLDFKEVNIAYSDENYYYLDTGINNNDYIITTNLSNIVKAGSKLKLYSKYAEE